MCPQIKLLKVQYPVLYLYLHSSIVYRILYFSLVKCEFPYDTQFSVFKLVNNFYVCRFWN